MSDSSGSDSDHKKKKKWFNFKKKDSDSSSSSSSDDENKKDKEKKKRKVKRKSSSSSDEGKKRRDSKDKKSSDEDSKVEVVKTVKTREVITTGVSPDIGFTRDVITSPGETKVTREVTVTKGDDGVEQVTTEVRTVTSEHEVFRQERKIVSQEVKVIQTGSYEVTTSETKVTSESSPEVIDYFSEVRSSKEPGNVEISETSETTYVLVDKPDVDEPVIVSRKRQGSGSSDSSKSSKSSSSDDEDKKKADKKSDDEKENKADDKEKGSVEVTDDQKDKIKEENVEVVREVLVINDKPKLSDDSDKEKKSGSDSSSESEDESAKDDQKGKIKEKNKEEVLVIDDKPKVSDESDKEKKSGSESSSESEDESKGKKYKIRFPDSSDSDEDEKKKEKKKTDENKNDTDTKEIVVEPPAIIANEKSEEKKDGKEKDKKSGSSSSSDSEDEKKDEVKKVNSSDEEKEKKDHGKSSDEEDDKKDKDNENKQPGDEDKLDKKKDEENVNKNEPAVVIHEVPLHTENQDDGKDNKNVTTLPAKDLEIKQDEPSPVTDKQAENKEPATVIVPSTETTEVHVTKPDVTGEPSQNEAKVENGVKVDDAAVIVLNDTPDVPAVDTVQDNTSEKEQNEDAPFFTAQNKLAPASALWTCQRDGAVLLRTTEEGPLSSPTTTVPTMIQKTIEKSPNRIAICVKRDGTWKKWTFKQYYNDIIKAAKSMIKLGLEPFNAVGILGFNSPEWTTSHFGAIYAGGLPMGIYATNSPEACEYLLKDSASNIAIVENDAQLQKVLKVWKNLPQLKAVVQYVGELTEKRDNLYTWNEFMALSEDVPVSLIQERLDGQAPNKACSLIYTSGATGNPKAVLLSHDNITWILEIGSSELGYSFAKDTIVSYLPLSHIAGQVMDMYLPMYYSSTVYFAQPDALKGSLGDTLKECRPNKFFGVPRVWEKMMEKMKERGQEIKGLKKKISTKAQQIGLRGSYAIMRRQKTPFGFGLANTFVFNKIKKELGLDRCEWCRTGAAPISKETIEFFWGFNIPLLALYGMSECTGPATCDKNEDYIIGGVGAQLTGSTIKIIKDEDDNDEVCIWGRHVFMGYLNNEEKTLQAFNKDFWLRSGDIGMIDDSGFLFITGRIKELIITAGGENIAPVPIEECVKAELPIVSHCVVIGDKRKFLSMLITLKTVVDVSTGEATDDLPKDVLTWCKAVGSEATTMSQILESKDENIYKAIQEGINRANMKSVSRAAKVQKWCILQKDFSISGGELTPTMKLKRPVVNSLYSEQIGAMYQESET